MVITDVMLDQACYDSGVFMVRWEGNLRSMHPLLAGALKVFLVQGICLRIDRAGELIVVHVLQIIVSKLI